MIHNLEKKCLGINSSPWKMLKKHLKNDDANGPNIALISVIIFGEDLR